ncbi:hypothetical protein [Geobacter sp.]|uniref:hypothetical protein n=1 Tax=Geobacter sp. TaxID=46610 RepID=UPI0026325673|nr:hypothetical protein [Geobacter sp.]
MKAKPYIGESVSILDSEELVDKAYSGLLAILDWVPKPGEKVEAMQFGGCGRKDMEHFQALTEGVYIPGSKRNYYWGTFDLDVDELPESGCVYVKPSEGMEFSYAAVKRVRRFKKGVVCQCKDPAYIYKVYVVEMPKAGKLCPIIEITYFAIDAHGDVWLTIDTAKFRDGKIAAFRIDRYAGSHYGPGALSLLADTKYLWMVTTEEPFQLSDSRGHAKVHFGIEEPMIQSLFYARSLPMTASGRRRPILHWVSAHKRRLEKGVEIDIAKYLRGVEAFSMGNLNFQITQPYKRGNPAGLTTRHGALVT